MSVQSLADRLTRDLLAFSREIERERAEFLLEKSELEYKVMNLEAQSEVKDRTIRDLTRRVALLEFAIRKDAAISDLPPLPDPAPSGPEISAFVLETLRRPPVRSCRTMIMDFLENMEISNSEQISDRHAKGASSASPPRLRLLRRISVALEPPLRFAISDSPAFPLLTGGSDGAVFLWASSEASSDPPRGLRGHEGPVTCGVTVDDTFFCAGFDGTIRKFVPAVSDQQEAVVFAHTDVVWCLAVDESSGRLISGGADRRLVFWRLENFSPESEIFLGQTPIAINFLADKIFVLTDACEVAVFERKTIRRLPELAITGQNGPATGGVIVGNFLCIALRSGNLITFDFRSAAVKSFSVSNAPLTAVAAVASDAALVAVGDASGTLRVLDIDSGIHVDEYLLDVKIENISRTNSRSLLVALADGSAAELVLQQ